MTRSTRWLALLAGFSTVLATTALWPSDASAQRRAVRRPPARPIVVRPVVVPVRPAFYYPTYYGYGLPLGWYSWGGWYPYGFYAQPYPYPYPAYYYRDYASSARLLIEPKHAEVYVDGHFVGLVDDFDGWSQRLRVAPGEHVVEVYLEGYRTYRQNVLFRPGATIRLQHELESLPAGETAEPRPAPSSAGYARPTARPASPVPAPRRGAPPPREGADASAYGALAIRVQPFDAEVIVDGERWESPEAGDLMLQLAEGTHNVEIRKEGFRTYQADVQVHRGETSTLNVSLARP